VNQQARPFSLTRVLSAALAPVAAQWVATEMRKLEERTLDPAARWVHLRTYLERMGKPR